VTPEGLVQKMLGSGLPVELGEAASVLRSCAQLGQPAAATALLDACTVEHAEAVAPDPQTSLDTSLTRP